MKIKSFKKWKKENGEKLAVHHIDYNKKNHNINNLIPLHHKCHAHTITEDRNCWKNYFENIMGKLIN
jgi:hypothetical protein